MLCPKCHRPLEGDEEYICCSSATIEWRCRDCFKVSEGVAFPYGACPQCGGRLELLEAPRHIDDADALAAVRTAFEIKLSAQAFYVRAARETEETVLRELFDKLAAQEREQMNTLSRRYHVEVPPPSGAFELDRAAIYAGIELEPEDPANLLRIAIACVQRATRFIGERGARVGPDSVAGQIYRELAAEGIDYVAFLTTEYELWKSGKAGLL